MKKQRVKKRLDPSMIAICVFLCVWGLIILYPFYNAVLLSITPRAIYIRTPFMLFPKGFTWSTYQNIFENKEVHVGFVTTLKLLAIGLPINMFLTTTMGYALSKESFPGKRFFLVFVIITMFFSGGIIPLYLVNRTLGLMNSLFSVILSTAMNTFYMILTKNYFESISPSLYESASIDGANELVIFAKIYLPLAKPILATIFLFYAVERWNEWYLAMLFLHRLDAIPLQLALRNIVSSAANKLGDIDTGRKIFPDGIKMAAVVVTMLPIMLLYPFLQKYFMKGIMLGAVKG